MMKHLNPDYWLGAIAMAFVVALLDASPKVSVGVGVFLVPMYVLHKWSGRRDA